MKPLARRSILTGGAAAALTLAAPPDANAKWWAPARLKDRADARGLTFGSMVCQDWVAQSPAYAQAIVRDCAIVTPGVEAKWWDTEPAEGQFNVTDLDQLGSEVSACGMQWRLHNLVWGIWNPDWVTQALADGRGEAVMTRHIQALAGRYAGRTLCWDVVNEPADPRWNSGPDGLLMTPWYNALGPTYVDLAFGLAHEADPEALLFVNDDYFEYADPISAAKRTLYLKQVEAWLKRGVPIHGFGLEAHLRPDMPFAAARDYRNFLAELAGMGLVIHVTELDVIDQTLPANTSVRDQMVADTAARFLDVVLDEPAVKAVVTWGLADQFSDMDQGAPRPDGLPTRGSPMNRNFAAKPFWWAIANALDHAPMR